MLTERLDKRIEVYTIKNIENELGQIEKAEVLLKRVWASISPATAKIVNSVAEATQSEHNFKFVFRQNAIKDISRDMFFKYKNQKYTIQHFTPNFKYKDRFEVLCKLVVI